MSKRGITPLWTLARAKLWIKNEYVRESLAEILGTAILLFFVCGSGMQHHLQKKEKGLVEDSMQPILGQMFGLLAAILITGGVSGAHLNPAVTLGLCLAGECNWFKFPLFSLCQFLGAYIGAGFAALTYWWATNNDFVAYFDDASVFSPISNAPIGSGFADQILTTSILMMTILACIDPRNMAVPKHLIGFYIILAVSGIIMCFGITAGAALNPARDLGPRLVALTIGYPTDYIMMNNGGKDHWWTVGFFGPLIGSAVGTGIYILIIGAQLKDLDTPTAIPGDANNNGKEGWRTTAFIPKAQAPPAHQIKHYEEAPYHHGQGNYPGQNGRH